MGGSRLSPLEHLESHSFAGEKPGALSEIGIVGDIYRWNIIEPRAEMHEFPEF